MADIHGLYGSARNRLRLVLGDESPLNLPLTPKARRLFAVSVILIGLCLFFGWRLFWFLTDDAYISFRYISNHIKGWGYAWNPPPFRPVEGYSNFLWAVLLEYVWRITGVAPPESANYISLALSYGTLALGVLIGLRLSLTGGAARYRHVLIIIALSGTVVNRTFLAWTSSGLETALFVFLVTLWVYLMLYTHASPRLWVFSAVSTATLLYFTRPDGMLILAATLTAVTLAASLGLVNRRHLIYALPVLSVPVHLAWRKSYYGAWLPNTYYAKYVKAWPEAGARYLLSFVIEYGAWIWLLLAAAFAAKWAARLYRDGRPPLRINLTAVTVAGTLLGVFGYYTFIIGGDHFEYRVYAHLVMPLFISGVWLADRVFSSGRAVVAAITLFVALSLPIPWTHWHITHDLYQRSDTFFMKRHVAGALPMLSGYARLFDEQQDWLIDHSICMRHQEHKAYQMYLTHIYPSREQGSTIGLEERAVYVVASVGMPGWVFPEAALIDVHGLNDYVIARTPADFQEHGRMMAHDRFPPSGYVQSFQPNFFLVPGDGGTGILWCDRRKPLTDEDITGWESKWWKWADNPGPEFPDGAGAENRGLVWNCGWTPVLDAADSLDLSPDERTYTFVLSPGITFRDGRELTASDFKYTIEHIMAPSTGSRSAQLFEGISGAREFMEGRADEAAGIRVEGRYTLVVELNEPDRHFLMNLAIPEAYALPAAGRGAGSDTRG